MKTITIEMPDDMVLPFADSDEQFGRELRLAAAIFWYDRGMISQGKGAEIAGLTRADFIDALGRANVERHPDHPRRIKGRHGTGRQCAWLTRPRSSTFLGGVGLEDDQHRDPRQLNPAGVGLRRGFRS